MPGLREVHDLGILFGVTRLPLADIYHLLGRILCFAGVTIPSLFLRRQGRDVSTLDMKPLHLAA